MTRSDDIKSIVLEYLQEEGLVDPLEDGYYHFWAGRGYLSAEALRIIADRLDELNASWHKQVTEDLEKLNDQDSNS